MLLHNKKQGEVRALDVSTKDFKYKYLIEQSYTCFDYQYYNLYIKNNAKDMVRVFKGMATDQLNKFVHNVFPERLNTIMHLIASNGHAYEIVDYLEEIRKKEGFVVPFLPNQDE